MWVENMYAVSTHSHTIVACTYSRPATKNSESHFNLTGPQKTQTEVRRKFLSWQTFGHLCLKLQDETNSRGSRARILILEFWAPWKFLDLHLQQTSASDDTFVVLTDPFGAWIRTETLVCASCSEARLRMTKCALYLSGWDWALDERPQRVTTRNTLNATNSVSRGAGPSWSES